MIFSRSLASYLTTLLKFQKCFELSLLGERSLIIYENVDVNKYQLHCEKNNYIDLLLLVIYLLSPVSTRLEVPSFLKRYS